MPSGPTHQKRTAAPPLPGLQPLPLAPVRLVHDPGFLLRTRVQPVHGPEFLRRDPAQPVRTLEFLLHAPERPVRGPARRVHDPEFLRRDPVAPVHAGQKAESWGFPHWMSPLPRSLHHEKGGAHRRLGRNPCVPRSILWWHSGTTEISLAGTEAS